MRWASACRCSRAVIGCAAACGDGQAPQGGPPPTPIQTLTASGRTIPSTIDTVGTLASPEPTVVAAEVPGTVTYVDIAEGQRVESGHVRVHTQLDYPGRQVDIFTDYLLKETTQGWLIFDVFKPPTVSEVTMRRAEYATVFEKRGFEHVLSAMETRILRNHQP